MGLLSIVDIEDPTAIQIEAIQTPSPAERASKDINLPDHYAQSIVYNQSHVAALNPTVGIVCRFLVVDAYKIYASTNIDLTALLIKQYYQVRFQQEFLIRDAKQFTGLQDCQARSTNKIEYHAKAALTAINVALSIGSQKIKKKIPFL
jgi:hypothetical protein